MGAPPMLLLDTALACTALAFTHSFDMPTMLTMIAQTKSYDLRF